MVDFTLMFYREKPVDWLMDHLLFTKVCNPERDMKECASEKRKIKVFVMAVFAPSHCIIQRTVLPAQFQHVGIHSSLNGKLQKLRDGSFGKNDVIGPSRNPPLERMYSDIVSYQRFSLTKLYQGTGNFWGQDNKKGTFAFISISF